MTFDEKTSSHLNLEKLLRSDLLPHLVNLIHAFPAFRALFPQLLQLRFVIDANIVQGELRWRLKSRKKRGAKTALHEVLDCGVLVAYAPHFLESEIQKHASRIADETHSSVEDVLREWTDFRRLLCFYTARAKTTMDVSQTDPKDVAYIDTMEEIGARAIYTRDRDFLRTTAPVVSVAIDTTLRQYARASTVRIAIVLGSSVSVAFGIEALIALAGLLSVLVRAARRLPLAAQLLVAGSVIVVLVHPKSRAKIAELWKLLNEYVSPPIWEAAVIAMHQFAEASSKEAQAYRELQEVLPPMRRRSLMLHVRAVCVAAHKPLSLDEIVRRVIADGYRPRSDRPHAYLLRKLRLDEQYVEALNGWLVRGTY
jgi:predicted nucleic acid-binding protein